MNNPEDIKRYLAEIVIGVLFLGLLGAGYLVGNYLIEVGATEKQIPKLKSDLINISHQINNYSNITDEEKKEWAQLKKDFMAMYPTSSLLPERINYSSIEKNFSGEGIPIESVELYERIFKIVRWINIPKIQIRTVGPGGPISQSEMDGLITSQQLNFKFLTQYSTAFRFITELRKLPFVLEVSELSMSRQQGLVEVSMGIQYFVRASADPFPQI